jgi:hypothetical protein
MAQHRAGAGAGGDALQRAALIERAIERAIELLASAPSEAKVVRSSINA